jgi:hypothetical protein
VLDDLLTSLRGDTVLDSLRGKWVARLVVIAAALSILAVVVVLVLVL